jgi:hypothetical protein
VPSRVTLARPALFEGVRGRRQPTNSTSAGSLTAVCPGCPLGRSPGVACNRLWPLWRERAMREWWYRTRAAINHNCRRTGKLLRTACSCAAGLLIRQLGCDPTMARGNRRIPGTRRLTRAAAAQRAPVGLFKLDD